MWGRLGLKGQKTEAHMAKKGSGILGRGSKPPTDLFEGPVSSPSGVRGKAPAA